MPGRASWHGERADALEAFARVFLLEALAGCQETRVAPSTQALLDGIVVGVTSDEHGWIRAAENSHALVEAPSLCLGLWAGDHRLWKELPGHAQDALAEWLAECADLERRSNNWVLFPFVISRFLDSVGRPHRGRTAIETHSLGRLEELYRGGGWYSDGGGSTFDSYNSFAFHFYPGVVGVLSSDDELRERSASRLALYLPQLLSLVGPDGAPVYFGRSMTYRFGVAAPLSVAALLGADLTPPGRLRVVTQRIVDSFVRIGAVTPGLPLSVGWARDDTDLVQDYSGPGAAYWAAHVFTNLLLEPDHAYWGAAGEEPVTEAGPTRLEKPNFVLARDAEASVVRLTNHGSYDVNVTDVKHRADDPFYGRLGYSTATLPLTYGADSTFTVHCRGRRYRRARITAQPGGRDWASSLGWLRDVVSAEDAPAPAMLLSVSTAEWDIHAIALPRWARVRRASVSFRGWCVDDPDAIGTGATDGPTVALTTLLPTTVRGLLGFSDAEVIDGERPRGRYRLGEVRGRDRGGLYVVATSLATAESLETPAPTVTHTGRGRWLIRIPGHPDRVLRRRRAALTLTVAEDA